ncbi:hypothetical protein [Alkalihalobacillus sp. BA299]|uniref:hypothetical protein n=1 Tax=Alkalihalobacillus sp. BA299 TaxID=2815938 RepID=UPI001ADC819B|nr:hypothetical protein [Alkalihalobacillus sp. BA299]
MFEKFGWGSSYDACADREEVKGYVNENGWDQFLSKLNEEFPNRNLYSVSTPWIDDNSYICKARGTKGDLIIGWNGVHRK